MADTQFSSAVALAVIDPYILAFSAITVIATIWMGFWSARKSKTASDFFVAGRSVSVGWNASAISGEYLSAASFMGVAGMVMSSGYDALWYPVCYACGYLFLLLFIAGPLRRFGAYTIPDFAEGRYDSPVFRKIAVVFVLFIGFFYTMPQMKGAGTTLAYIFPGLPYWTGVVLVGAVITLNVALGGMKGITLVQAFQYWLKMFAISVPIFVLMAVYGHYGRQLGLSGSRPAIQRPANISWIETALKSDQPGPAGQPGKPLISRLLPGVGSSQRLANVILHPRPVELRSIEAHLQQATDVTGTHYVVPKEIAAGSVLFGHTTNLTNAQIASAFERALRNNQPEWRGSQGPRKENLVLIRESDQLVYIVPSNLAIGMTNVSPTRSLPDKAPKDETWLNPFGPLTTKAAKATAAAMDKSPAATIPLRVGLTPEQRLSVNLDSPTPAQALAVYGELTCRQLAPRTNSLVERVDEMLGGALTKLKLVSLVSPSPLPDNGVRFHNDGRFTVAEVKSAIESNLRTNGLALVVAGDKTFSVATISASPGKAWLANNEKPLALLYTYSLIIALVCGTAGLPHILVRFYTNPDGVAAKRTTMWVMILIGIFYVFPPVFGVLGRNLMPELYSGVGAKGTDKIVLELPRILNEKYGVLGSVLSGITCAGAFAAFMSTFSGLLVSMTGALAHDVYGRMLRPKASADQRMRMFKVCAVICGGVAILLGMQVEALQINFMVGQAFAIAAASYFPLLFMSVWWRGMTMKGAAIGMLTGGICALAAVTLTNFSDLKWVNLDGFWAVNPLLRILCEQPAIWTVPLAIGLMIVVSKLTRSEAPSDVRMKMLVLHAPEKLGLKQEYIQEHQSGH